MKKYLEAYRMVLGQDSSIAVSRDNIDTSAGVTEQYLDELGLEKRYLKKLERDGLAIRGRTKNIWVPGETLPNGETAQQGSTYRTNGSKVRWILIRETH